MDYVISLNDCAMWLGYAVLASQLVSAVIAVPVGGFLLWRYRRKFV
jgi:hypothetical protein